MRKIWVCALLAATIWFTACSAQTEKGEGIWLQMTAALHTGERVHIIAYDTAQQDRITKLLAVEGMDMSRIDFTLAKSDDVWTRDTGPMFVLDAQGKLVIADFVFDGWGEKVAFAHDDAIPQAVANGKGLPRLSIPAFILEGGSVELDGSGTAMLCKSSVVSKARNPGMSVQQAEEYLTRYLVQLILFGWRGSSARTSPMHISPAGDPCATPLAAL